MCFEQPDRDEYKIVFGEEAKRVTLLDTNALQILWFGVLVSRRAKHFICQKSKIE
jgi:hypothetical protein